VQTAEEYLEVALARVDAVRHRDELDMEQLREAFKICTQLMQVPPPPKIHPLAQSV
jgi:hypothetical protein